VVRDPRPTRTRIPPAAQERSSTRSMLAPRARRRSSILS
jgi:hypothetical protein